MKPVTKSSVLAVATMLAGTNVHAAPASGNLNVTTTVSVVCSSPSPSGNLVLPFDARFTLISQSFSQSVVEVTVECDGAPTVNYVKFDDGMHRAAVNDAVDGVRYMLRSGGSNGEAGDVLGYQLFAFPNLLDQPSLHPIGTGASENDNKLQLGTTGSATYFVNGRVFDGTGGRFGVYTFPHLVPAGDYHDTVVMTIDYGASS